LIVVIVAGVFIRLGFWQLDRLDERRQLNAVVSERLDAQPVPLDEIADPLESEYRTVTVSGIFDSGQEVLIRSQTHLGTAGFHVITPLVDEDRAVLVNRGWVPLDYDEVPVVEAPPPSGVVTVEGWIHLTQLRPTLGPEDPPGKLGVFNRVDIERIQAQIDVPLAEVYVVDAASPGELPEPARPPDFTDEGPHLAYAIQWFGFALVGLAGFYFLVKRKGGRAPGASGQADSRPD
jgi:surfeit locus 1 family protein